MIGCGSKVRCNSAAKNHPSSSPCKTHVMNIYGKRNLCSLPQYKILITEQGGSDAQLKAYGKNTDVRVGTQNYHLAVYFLLF